MALLFPISFIVKLQEGFKNENLDVIRKPRRDIDISSYKKWQSYENASLFQITKNDKAKIGLASSNFDNKIWKMKLFKYFFSISYVFNI